MSRIFQAGSGVEAKSVRFAEIDEEGNTDHFLIPSDRENSGENSAAGEPDEAPVFQQAAGAQSSAQIPADIEAIKQEAYTRGRADGKKEAEKKLNSAVRSLGEALEQVSGMRKSLAEKSRDDMIRLVMAVARRVIDEEISGKKDIIVKNVSRALDAAVEADEYYIRVNPADLETVKEHEPMFLASMKGLQNIHFVPDESISRGGCIAESRTGDVDATIESQLEEIRGHLAEAVN